MSIWKAYQISSSLCCVRALSLFLSLSTSLFPAGCRELQHLLLKNKPQRQHSMLLFLLNLCSAIVYSPPPPSWASALLLLPLSQSLSFSQTHTPPLSNPLSLSHCGSRWICQHVPMLFITVRCPMVVLLLFLKLGTNRWLELFLTSKTLPTVSK